MYLCVCVGGSGRVGFWSMPTCVANGSELHQLRIERLHYSDKPQRVSSHQAHAVSLLQGPSGAQGISLVVQPRFASHRRLGAEAPTDKKLLHLYTWSLGPLSSLSAYADHKPLRRTQVQKRITKGPFMCVCSSLPFTAESCSFST